MDEPLDNDKGSEALSSFSKSLILFAQRNRNCIPCQPPLTYAEWCEMNGFGFNLAENPTIQSTSFQKRLKMKPESPYSFGSASKRNSGTAQAILDDQDSQALPPSFKNESIYLRFEDHLATVPWRNEKGELVEETLPRDLLEWSECIQNLAQMEYIAKKGDFINFESSFDILESQQL